MRRDTLQIDIRNIGWVETEDSPSIPTVIITSTDTREALRNRLTGRGEHVPSADEIDLTYRYQTSSADSNASGILSVTNRVTGAFLLELPVPADRITEFTTAAERFVDESDTDECYRLEVGPPDDRLLAANKQILLVYAHDGTLLRHRSLIPPGIEV